RVRGEQHGQKRQHTIGIHPSAHSLGSPISRPAASQPSSCALHAGLRPIHCPCELWLLLAQAETPPRSAHRRGVWTNSVVKTYRAGMEDIHVIDDPAAAAAVLDPLRSRLLWELREPASAAVLAG